MTKSKKAVLLTLTLAGGLSLSASAQQLLYIEAFQPPTATTGDQPIALVGWINDIAQQNTRLAYGSNFANKPSSDYSTYSYSNPGFTEAFYTTTANSSTNGGFTAINLSLTSGLKFSADTQSPYNAGNSNGYFALQIGNGNWYVSNTSVAPATGAFVTQTLTFDPNAWNNLTIPTSGTDSFSSATIGGPAGTLSGMITGVGFVVDHFGGDGLQNFDNYSVSGTVVPEPSTWAITVLGGFGLLAMMQRSRARLRA